ncbi:hypothetical protein HC028_24045 [Planosporangium flavigriseum]|uniref:Uncharacterized protein n=1 Tax=Planosporangium flavigriseum TaxID=373681 RepID=A0A8J3PMV8_9ACTN|nr:hypothetical protein [Planosporangium flavigriseum]NJC67550.1 hypothetical protein [Planosporangium flavigriseum]GIG75961.1 hypothetical protein Pfl04_43650 [Planosporangium flavigriseum]
MQPLRQENRQGSDDQRGKRPSRCAEVPSHRPLGAAAGPIRAVGATGLIATLGPINIVGPISTLGPISIVGPISTV